LRDLRDCSSRFVDDEELRSLETYALRIRGEIFFAERWLIVEGQADFLIVHAMANALDYDLDEHGVSVIDAQNNGSPATFAVLARALDIPWLAVFDGDGAGQRYCEAIAKRKFADDEINHRCRTHPDGDLEAQLVADGLGTELREIMATLTGDETADLTEQALLNWLRGHKTDYAAILADRFRDDFTLVQHAPASFQAAIEQLRGLT